MDERYLEHMGGNKVSSKKVFVTSVSSVAINQCLDEIKSDVQKVRDSPCIKNSDFFRNTITRGGSSVGIHLLREFIDQICGYSKTEQEIKSSIARKDMVTLENILSSFLKLLPPFPKSFIPLSTRKERLLAAAETKAILADAVSDSKTKRKAKDPIEKKGDVFVPTGKPILEEHYQYLLDHVLIPSAAVSGDPKHLILSAKYRPEVDSFIGSLPAFDVALPMREVAELSYYLRKVKVGTGAVGQNGTFQLENIRKKVSHRFSHCLTQAVYHVWLDSVSKALNKSLKLSGISRFSQPKLLDHITSVNNHLDYWGRVWEETSALHSRKGKGKKKLSDGTDLVIAKDVRESVVRIDKNIGIEKIPVLERTRSQLSDVGASSFDFVLPVEERVSVAKSEAAISTVLTKANSSGSDEIKSIPSVNISPHVVALNNGPILIDENKKYCSTNVLSGLSALLLDHTYNGVSGDDSINLFLQDCQQSVNDLVVGLISFLRKGIFDVGSLKDKVRTLVRELLTNERTYLSLFMKKRGILYDPPPNGHCFFHVAHVLKQRNRKLKELYAQCELSEDEIEAKAREIIQNSIPKGSTKDDLLGDYYEIYKKEMTDEIERLKEQFLRMQSSQVRGTKNVEDLIEYLEDFLQYVQDLSLVVPGLKYFNSDWIPFIFSDDDMCPLICFEMNSNKMLNQMKNKNPFPASNKNMWMLLSKSNFHRFCPVGDIEMLHRDANQPYYIIEFVFRQLSCNAIGVTTSTIGTGGHYQILNFPTPEENVE